MRFIEKAQANPDLTVTIEWQGGGTDTIDFKPNVAKGGVCAPLADPAFFTSKMYVAEDGYFLGWPEEIEFSADSLWYRAHPDELKRDYPEAAAE
jgi:hypothetical protein